MALRNIRKYGDEILRKKCRVVDEINERILTLIKDMAETMYKADGVGIAAPQVGILKRIFVIDVYDGEGTRVFINPEILEKDGEQIDVEGCLSLPGEQGEVKRPERVKVKALDMNGNEFTLSAEGLLARAICHENDHLDGILFVDHVEKQD
ncbi:peptide deformylase [Clostridium fallax]|uniref:Peptide deformylase n=1 Tax=Clostridium fallax TaxID=1533 RepID=A0A1M4UU13_9CLOT|nr:peptide deformylase [Clostridium fallax]SHE60113.1 peptide deformylase [Clostridium fallax]SQB07305.1 peptide deformylase [Clostridium fallax]